MSDHNGGNNHVGPSLAELEQRALRLAHPIEVEDWQAVFMAKCQNGHEPATFLIGGLDRFGVCPTCQRGYRINGIHAMPGEPLQVRWTIAQQKADQIKV